MWTKTPRQCNFFSNTAEYFESWAVTPDWANVITQLFAGDRAGTDSKHNWWSLAKGCIEIWKDGARFDLRLRNWESWLLMKDIQKGISRHSAVWLIIIMGNIQSQANKCAFSWLWQSQEIIELSLLLLLLILKFCYITGSHWQFRISHKNSAFGTGFR